MSFYLVGAGVRGDLTKKGLEVISKCDRVFCEFYTSLLPDGWKENTEKMLNKRIEELGREEVESSFLIEESKDSHVALIVGGDPLTATTHHILLEECSKHSIHYEVVHNSSILSVAPGRAGLQHYKFGKVATLAWWSENYKPTSPLEIIKSNLNINAHTLLLLDLGEKPMTVRDAVLQLEEMQNDSPIVKKAVALSRVAWDDEKIAYGTIEELKELEMPAPASLIIPSKLHFKEEDFLKKLALHYTY